MLIIILNRNVNFEKFDNLQKSIFFNHTKQIFHVKLKKNYLVEKFNLK